MDCPELLAQLPLHVPAVSLRKTATFRPPAFSTQHSNWRHIVVRCAMGTEEDPKEWPRKPKPQSIYFLTKNNSVVTAQAGSKAILPCSVRNLCDGTISWIRRKDYNLLTVGANTYAGDERFQAVHTFNSDDWSLQIKFVRLVDAGYYECQVTSHPPFSIIVLLKVVEARTEITGPAERFIKLGSSVELNCKVVESPAVPEFVFWYHNDRMVNYDKGRGMNITTDLQNKKSSLRIAKATPEHSGNYSCAASNAHPHSTFLHILNDEKPAAMQTSVGGRWRGGGLLILASLLLARSPFLD